MEKDRVKLSYRNIPNKNWVCGAISTLHILFKVWKFREFLYWNEAIFQQDSLLKSIAKLFWALQYENDEELDNAT